MNNKFNTALQAMTDEDIRTMLELAVGELASRIQKPFGCQEVEAIYDKAFSHASLLLDTFYVEKPKQP